MRKKLLIILVVLIAVVSVGYIGTYAYHVHNSKVIIGVGHGSGMETISMLTMGPTSWDVQNKWMEVHMWNNLVITELSRETQQPRDIRVSGEVKDGKTTLRYEGTYTTKDGATAEYFEEKTFDFELDLDKQLLED